MNPNQDISVEEVPEQPSSEEGKSSIPDSTDDRSEFEKYHDSFRPLRRGKVFFQSRTKDNGKVYAHTYTREHLPTEIKGKKAQRFAKRQRVAEMKKTQGN